MHKNETVVNGYTITDNPNFQNERYGITLELNRLIEKLYYEVKENRNSKIIDKLNNLIESYPQIPIFKNYLSVVYQLRGDLNKAISINDQIIAVHPDYLFGKLFKANQYLEQGKLEIVPDILGNTLELRDLYPTRDVFHLSELTGYLKAVIRYLAAIEDLEMAESKLEFLKEIAPDHPDTQSAEQFLFALRLKNASKRMLEEQKSRITPTLEHPIVATDKTTAPIFNHAEIEWLYNNGLRIPSEKLKTILALPRQTLIQDLEAVLNDGIERFNHFEDTFEEEKTSFVLHSLILLGELNAVESLPKIFSFFKIPKQIIDHWLGDHITETVWQVFYKLGFSNTQTLKNFLLEPAIDTYSKVAVSEALCQICLHYPERKEEILSVYKDVLTTFLDADIDDNLIDSEFLGLAITDIEDCGFKELLPIIKELYENKYVSEGICGTYQKLEKTFAQQPFSRVREVYSIFDLYNNVVTNWHGYSDDFKKKEDFAKNTPYNFTQNTGFEQAVSNKIGRNEPCPCGSGKKYKKCCGGN
jgi:tetratricopeptide (TPR) repeat protein